MVLDENGNVMHKLTTLGKDAVVQMIAHDQEWKELKKKHPFKWLWKCLVLK